jgi:hypothetical protein
VGRVAALAAPTRTLLDLMLLLDDEHRSRGFAICKRRLVSARADTRRF